MADGAVKDALEQWGHLHPELDLRPMAIWGRIARLALLADRHRAAILASHGLQQSDIGVLAALYRHGGDLRPRELCRWMLVASGTITPRIDRLEAAGLAERLPDPDDRRGKVVRLTREGRALAPAVVAELLEVEAALLDPLPARSQDRLARDLAQLLAVVPDPEE